MEKGATPEGEALGIAADDELMDATARVVLAIQASGREEQHRDFQRILAHEQQQARRLLASEEERDRLREQLDEATANRTIAEREAAWARESATNAGREVSRLTGELERLRAALPDGLEPVKYRVAGARAGFRDDALDSVYIEHRLQRDGSVLWAITNDTRDVMNRDGEWEWEPQPSSRDDAFMARTRFASVGEAMAILRAARSSGAATRESDHEEA